MIKRLALILSIAGVFVFATGCADDVNDPVTPEVENPPASPDSGGIGG